MSLAAGRRLGHYEVTGQIGAGGIGGVWNPNGKELFYRTGDKMMSEELKARVPIK